MDIRSILVHLDHRKHTPDRVAYAAALALAHDAHLVGVAPIGWVSAPAGASGSPGLQEYLRSTMALLRQQAQASVDHFNEVAGGLGVRSFDAHVVAADASGALVQAARYCDLSVITQTEPDEWVSTQAPEMPHELLLQAGRPVLVLPYAGKPVLPTRARVLVAWNASRESARALHDALPLLRQAGRVDVVVFEPPAVLDRRPVELPDVDVGQWLARHEVRAELARLGTTISVGEALLSHAADVGADLIVAGGYGHSRLREAVLGGVTRTLLTASPVPVLLSH